MKKSAIVTLIVLVIGLAGIIALTIALSRLSAAKPAGQEQTAAPVPAAPAAAPEKPKEAPRVAKVEPPPVAKVEPPEQRQPGLAERLLPADALAALVVRNVPEIARQAQKTDLAELLNDPQVAAFFAAGAARVKSMMELDGKTADALPEPLRDPFGLAWKSIQNLSGDLGIAFRFSPNPPGVPWELSVFFVVDLREPQQLEQVIQALSKFAEVDNLWTARDAAGVTVHTLKDGTNAFSYAIDRGLFLAAFDEMQNPDAEPNVTLIDELLARRSDEGVPRDSLWRNDRYQAILAKLPVEAGALLFGDLPAIFQIVTASMKQEGMDTDSIDALNLLGFGPAGFRLLVADKVVRQDVRVLFTDTTRGLPALLATLPKDRPEAMLNAMPADALFAVAATVDPPELWRAIKALVAEVSPNAFGELEQGLAEAKEEAGLDIEADAITPLGRTMGLFVPADGGPFPPIGALRNLSSTLVLIELRDPERVLKTLDGLIPKEPSLGLATASFRDVEVRTVTLPLGQAKGVVDTFTRLEPSYAVVDNLLVAGLNGSAVRVFIREHLDHKPTLAANETVKKELAKVSPDYSVVSFLDNRAATQTAYDAILPMLGMVSKLTPVKLGIDMTTLPPKDLVAGALQPEIGVVSIRPDELSIESLWSPGAQGLVLAGEFQMLASVVEAAHARARQAHCMSKLRQIATSCMQFKEDKGRWPLNLQVLVHNEMFPADSLTCPLDAAPRQVEGLATSYDSAFELAGTELAPEFADNFAALSSQLMMAWDSQPRHAGQRIVAFFDSHIETVTEERFNQLMQQLKETLAKAKAAE